MSAVPSGRKIRMIALASGALGATAACLGKFAFDPHTFEPTPFGYAMRAVCLVSMIGCNAGMLGSFISGMEESGSVAGTALSSASNFATSAFLGYVIWDETFTPQWWLGFTLVILGIALISSTSGNEKSKTK